MFGYRGIELQNNTALSKFQLPFIMMRLPLIVVLGTI